MNLFHVEYIDFWANRLLSDPPKVKLLPDDMIEFGNFTVRRGVENSKPGLVYFVEVGVPVGGTRYEPPGVDLVEIGECNSFYEAVRMLFKAYLEQCFEADIPDMFKQLEEMERVAHGVFARGLNG